MFHFLSGFILLRTVGFDVIESLFDLDVAGVFHDEHHEFIDAGDVGLGVVHHSCGDHTVIEQLADDEPGHFEVALADVVEGADE